MFYDNTKMSKVIHYDLRPVDTEIVVYTRNRIRLQSVLIILGILLYLNISPSFNQPHASWVHLVHLILQPFIIFVSVADSSTLAFGAFIASVSTVLQDVGILILNVIAVERCLGESTASCSEIITEKGILLLLALWFCIFGFLISIQTMLLKNKLQEKDKKEFESIKEQREGGDSPTWNSIDVFCNKMKVICLFLLLFDFVNISLSTSYISENPMFALSTAHLFIDPFVLFTVTKSKTDSLTYNVMRVIYLISLLMNLIISILLIQMEITDVGKMLLLMISITYVIFDLIQILYASKIVETVNNFKKYKSKS